MENKTNIEQCLDIELGILRDQFYETKNEYEYSLEEILSPNQLRSTDLEIEKNNNKYDLIILDPPAFAKNKKSVPTALVGYAKINKLAMKLLSDGGFLATSSCSQHIQEDAFYNIITKQAQALNKNIRLLYRGLQSPDHPILCSMPETKYLKFFVVR